MPGNMSDEAIREEAIAWLARLRADTTEADQRAFESWYARNSRHADIYDALLDAWDETVPSVLPLTGGIDANRKRWVKLALASAAALLLLLVGTLAASQVQDTITPSQTMLASRPGEIRTVELADGSRVILDTDSAVQTEFTSGHRYVRLDRGRVRFEVASGTRPFIVAVGQSEVVALGTVFDVDRRHENTLVALFEGAVDVRGAAGIEERFQSVRLKPGQQVEVQKNRTIAEPVITQNVQTRWPSGMLSFENMRVAEVVAAANRYSDTHILITSPTIGNRRFTGTINTGDQHQLAETIATMFAVTARRDHSQNIVLVPRE